MAFERKEKRFYAESRFERNRLTVAIYDTKNRNRNIGNILVEIRPSGIWIDVDSYEKVASSNRDFIKMFNRSVGQELLIRAFRWGQKNKAGHIDLSTTRWQGERTLKRAIDLGYLAKDGKILKVPRQLNLKETRLFEKPLIPRKSLLRKPGKSKLSRALKRIRRK